MNVNRNLSVAGAVIRGPAGGMGGMGTSSVQRQRSVWCWMSRRKGPVMVCRHLLALASTG